MHRFSAVILGSLLLTLFALTPHSLIAQTVTPDDIAAVMIDATAVPGYHIAGESSPGPRLGATNDQRTRIFIADDSATAGYSLLTLIITVPNENAICLPFFPGNISSGGVLDALNSDHANYEHLGLLGVGDVETAARWSDLDTGANLWTSVLSVVFMRGRVTVYMTLRTHRDFIDPSEMEPYVRAQDAKLIAAMATDSPVGIAAATPVPPPPADRPAICG